jgi:hypothetical protein
MEIWVLCGQALALAKLIHEDPSVQDRDMILMKAHMKLADTYMEMVCCFIICLDSCILLKP